MQNYGSEPYGCSHTGQCEYLYDLNDLFEAVDWPYDYEDGDLASIVSKFRSLTEDFLYLPKCCQAANVDDVRYLIGAFSERLQLQPYLADFQPAQHQHASCEGWSNDRSNHDEYYTPKTYNSHEELDTAECMGFVQDYYEDNCAATDSSDLPSESFQSEPEPQTPSLKALSIHSLGEKFLASQPTCEYEAEEYHRVWRELMHSKQADGESARSFAARLWLLHSEAESLPYEFLHLATVAGVHPHIREQLSKLPHTQALAPLAVDFRELMEVIADAESDYHSMSAASPILIQDVKPSPQLPSPSPIQPPSLAHPSNTLEAQIAGQSCDLQESLAEPADLMKPSLCHPPLIQSLAEHPSVTALGTAQLTSILTDECDSFLPWSLSDSTTEDIAEHADMPSLCTSCSGSSVTSSADIEDEQQGVHGMLIENSVQPDIVEKFLLMLEAKSHSHNAHNAGKSLDLQEATEQLMVALQPVDISSILVNSCSATSTVTDEYTSLISIAECPDNVEAVPVDPTDMPPTSDNIPHWNVSCICDTMLEASETMTCEDVTDLDSSQAIIPLSTLPQADMSPSCHQYNTIMAAMQAFPFLISHALGSRCTCLYTPEKYAMQSFISCILEAQPSLNQTNADLSNALSADLLSAVIGCELPLLQPFFSLSCDSATSTADPFRASCCYNLTLEPCTQQILHTDDSTSASTSALNTVVTDESLSMIPCHIVGHASELVFTFALMRTTSTLQPLVKISVSLSAMMTFADEQPHPTDTPPPLQANHEDDLAVSPQLSYALADMPLLLHADFAFQAVGVDLEGSRLSDLPLIGMCTADNHVMQGYILAVSVVQVTLVTTKSFLLPTITSCNLDEAYLHSADHADALGRLFGPQLLPMASLITLPSGDVTTASYLGAISPNELPCPTDTPPPLLPALEECKEVIAVTSASNILASVEYRTSSDRGILALLESVASHFSESHLVCIQHACSTCHPCPRGYLWNAVIADEDNPASSLAIQLSAVEDHLLHLAASWMLLLTTPSYSISNR